MSDRKTALVIFLLSFSAFAWLTPVRYSDWQIYSRLGLTLSIVECGQLNIDRFADHTGDRALFEGHYYTDKVPGLSFLAIPSVAATVLIIKATGGAAGCGAQTDFARFARVAIISVNGFISALATALLFFTARRLGATRPGALFAAGTLAFATPFMGWSTAFFAHSVSGGLMIFVAAALAFAFSGDRADRTGQFHPPSFLSAVMLGILLGYIVVIDLTAAPACIVGAAIASGLGARSGASVFSRTLFGIALGGTLGLLPLLVYNQVAFGSPFKLGYASVVGFEGMRQGFYGITWPRLHVLKAILFGRHRGLLPLSPVLLFVPVGLYSMWRQPKTRVAAGAIFIVCCSFLWINASYYYWHGGWSTGPRFLIPMLPVACLALAFAWPSTFGARLVTLVLLGISLILTLVCAVTDMFAPSSYSDPLVDFLFPKFLTPEGLLNSAPIVLIWLLFGLLLLRRNPPLAYANHTDTPIAPYFKSNSLMSQFPNVPFSRIKNWGSTIAALIVSVHEAALYTCIDWKSDYLKVGAARWSRSRLKRYLKSLAESPALALVLFRIRTAQAIRIRHHDNGFFANLLAVLDILAHARPTCRVVVDWTLDGTEKHFKYGQCGTNVWNSIFEPLQKGNKNFYYKELSVNGRLNPLLISTGRDVLSRSPNLKKVRRKYARIYKDNVRIRSEYVLHQVEAYRRKMDGHVCLGVHKRVGLPQVAANQISSRLPTVTQIMSAVDFLATTYRGENLLIYLATDEIDCLDRFVSHFGKKVLFRPEVHRVWAGDEVEVHTQASPTEGLKNACDVLIDALLLASCDQVLHLSSNITTCVGFLNVHTKLTHFDDIHPNAGYHKNRGLR